MVPGTQNDESQVGYEYAIFAYQGSRQIGAWGGLQHVMCRPPEQSNKRIWVYRPTADNFYIHMVLSETCIISAFTRNVFQTDVSQTDVSQTNVSQTNVSQTNVSQTNVSQTNVSRTSNFRDNAFRTSVFAFTCNVSNSIVSRTSNFRDNASRTSAPRHNVFRSMVSCTSRSMVSCTSRSMASGIRRVKV
ncbi:hypothetical protein E4U15_008098 [Claviceps sp. LM218 group G6]|nr:hypothetical protein E4U15_008098 [Claviceps sp. LM218 group G6]